MKFFSKGEKEKEKTEEEKREQTAKDWLPIKEVKNGIVLLKNGQYIKILEIVPVNFKLKSRAEKRALIYNYRAFLKACRFPMQISIQCRKANVEPHIERMKKFYKLEKNENVRNMIKGYINLVKMIGSKGAITRRYFIIVSFIPIPGTKNNEYLEVIKQLEDKKVMIKEFISKCGNDVVDASDTEFAVDVLYSYLNKRTCEVQKLGKKLITLMGAYLESAEGGGA